MPAMRPPSRHMPVITEDYQIPGVNKGMQARIRAVSFRPGKSSNPQLDHGEVGFIPFWEGSKWSMEYEKRDK